MMKCGACDKPVADGAMVYDDMDGGVFHADCLGWPDDTDADGFCDMETGEPVDERPEPRPFVDR